MTRLATLFQCKQCTECKEHFPGITLQGAAEHLLDQHPKVLMYDAISYHQTIAELSPEECGDINSRRFLTRRRQGLLTITIRCPSCYTELDQTKDGMNTRYGCSNELCQWTDDEWAVQGLEAV